jgi:hypothetical protein
MDNPPGSSISTIRSLSCAAGKSCIARWDMTSNTRAAVLSSACITCGSISANPTLIPLIPNSSPLTPLAHFTSPTRSALLAKSKPPSYSPTLPLPILQYPPPRHRHPNLTLLSPTPLQPLLFRPPTTSILNKTTHHLKDRTLDPKRACEWSGIRNADRGRALANPWHRMPEPDR